jgi:hypothetical protein
LDVVIIKYKWRSLRNKDKGRKEGERDNRATTTKKKKGKLEPSIFPYNETSSS